MTVQDNSRALKFDHFSEFQKFISDNSLFPPPSVIMTLSIRKSICDSSLNVKTEMDERYILSTKKVDLIVLKCLSNINVLNNNYGMEAVF